MGTNTQCLHIRPSPLAQPLPEWCEEGSCQRSARMKRVCFLIVAIVMLPTHALAQGGVRAEGVEAASLWFVRIGVLDAIYHPSATIATSGVPIAGATATVSNNITPMFDLGYHVTKTLSIQMMGGIPPKPTVTGERTVASLGDLGAVRYGPVFLTGTYHIPRWRGWQAYAGAGAV